MVHTDFGVLQRLLAASLVTLRTRYIKETTRPGGRRPFSTSWMTEAALAKGTSNPMTGWRILSAAASAMSGMLFISSWKTAVLCTIGHAKQHLLDRGRTGIAIGPSLQSVLSGALATSLQKGSIADRLALCSRAPLSSWLASHLVVFSWPARAGVFQMNSLALPSGISRSIDVVRATNAVLVTAYQRLFVTGDCDLAIVALFASAGVPGSADLR